MAPSASQTRAQAARATAGKADWAAVVRTSGPGGKPGKSDARGVLSRAEMTSRIGQLGDMGFSEAASRRALENNSWNVNSALDQLFRQGDEPEKSACQASGAASTSDSSSLLKTPAPAKAVPAQVPKPAQPAGEESATRCPSDAHSQTNSQEGSGDEGSPLRDQTGNSATSGETPPRQPSPEAVGKLQPAGVRGGPASAGPACDDAHAVGGPTPAEEQKGAERCLELDEAATPVEEPCLEAPAHEGRATARPALEQEKETSAVAPLRQLWRVRRDWSEEDPNKLAVQRGGVVYVWPGTETDLGWAYGELVSGAPGAGWLPLSIVKQLPMAHQVLRARRDVVSGSENQLPLQEGAGYLVDTATRTAEGWTHATELQSDASGWVPAAALVWPAGLP